VNVNYPLVVCINSHHL